MTDQMSDRPTSARRIAANRANAQLSTGPRTPEGKARSSLNALRTGRYASSFVAVTRGLLAEDPAEVEAFCDGVAISFDPRDALEITVVQSIVQVMLDQRRASEVHRLLLERASRSTAARRKVIGDPHVVAVELEVLRDLRDIIVDPDGKVDTCDRTLAMTLRGLFDPVVLPGKWDATTTPTTDPQWRLARLLVVEHLRETVPGLLAEIEARSDVLLERYGEVEGRLEEEAAVDTEGVLERWVRQQGKAWKGMDEMLRRYTELRSRPDDQVIRFMYPVHASAGEATVDEPQNRGTNPT